MVEKLKPNKTVTIPAPTKEKSGKKETKANKTIIEKCTCESVFQDEKYGKGMRVKNSSSKGNRCTVCGK